MELDELQQRIASVREELNSGLFRENTQALDAVLKLISLLQFPTDEMLLAEQEWGNYTSVNLTAAMMRVLALGRHSTMVKVVERELG